MTAAALATVALAAVTVPACKSRSSRDQAPATSATPAAPDPADPANAQGAGVRPPDTRADAGDLHARAVALARSAIIADGHIDLPYRLRALADDGAPLPPAQVTAGTDAGNFDYPRAVAGGLNAPFMSIYVPARHQTEGGAKKLADELIDLVESVARASDGKMAVARSPDDVVAHKAAGVLSLAMGIENGAALEGEVANVAHFHGRGVRYITLTHSKDNDLCDSSYDTRRTHKGLSALGRKVVAEMNRVGIMVDISHVSDDTARQVLALSEVPVIASHSSARAFVPGFERDMSDDLIRALAGGGGVILINFGSTFLRADANAHGDARRKARDAFAAERKLAPEAPAVKAFVAEWDAGHPLPRATVSDVADHIDHVVQLVGVDHVGFGSDFDGVGDSLPTGLEDVSEYPNLIAELLRRGYAADDVRKIAGDNVLRVWRAVEAHAAGRRP